MRKPRAVYFSENFVCSKNIKQMGNDVHLFLNLLSVADDAGRMQATFRELSQLTREPVPKLRRWLKRLRDHEYIAVQGRGLLTIVIHPDYVIPPELRNEDEEE